MIDILTVIFAGIGVVFVGDALFFLAIRHLISVYKIEDEEGGNENE